MNSAHAIMMADASGLRNLVRFAQITGLQLSNFLNKDMMQLVDMADTLDRVPVGPMIDMLELCALVGQRPAIGIETASWADLHTSLGILRILLDACPTLADALRIQSQYVHLESFALDATVEPLGNEMVFRYLFRVQGQFGHSQYAEGAMLVAIRLLRLSLGEMWSPLRIEFEHQRPEDLRLHKMHFRCPIEFGANRTGLFITPDELNRQLPHGNAKVLAYLEKNLESLNFEQGRSIEDEVIQFISQNLASANASLAVIAKAMGLQPRALQRRLANEELEFSELLARVRKQTVENYVQSEREPDLLQLAYRLGYSEASNASRFLRQQFGKGLREMIREKSQARIHS